MSRRAMHQTAESKRDTWVTRLASKPFVHRAIRVLRVQQAAERVFKTVPLRRRLKKSGARYRVRWLESFLIADEIFSREIYGEALDGKNIETFVDIGSNVGYFPLYVFERTANKNLIGLLVDGNSEMVHEAKWHVEHAKLDKVHVLHGLAGFPQDVKEASFFVNASNAASSAQPQLNPNVPAKGESREVKVRAVDILSEWKRIAGDKRIDLMKIDIEGFECDFIRNTKAALALTDRVVLEWHKWITTQDEVEGLLAEQGFTRKCIISDEEHAGVGVYDRTSTPS